MKLERTVIILFVATLIAVASSVYYSYVNFNTGENSGTIARSAHNVIDMAYQVQFRASVVENASDEFIISHEPFYAGLAHKEALALDSAMQNLADSVMSNPVQAQRAAELGMLITTMEHQLPGVDSGSAKAYDKLPRFVRNKAPENFMDKIIAKNNEIITEEFRLLGIRRSTAQYTRRNSAYATYYTAAAALLFIIVILLWLNRDIRRRRTAENKIRESEEKLRQMLEEVGDVIFSSDYTGNFTFINARLGTLTGYNAEELIGKHFTQLVQADWREKAKEFYYQQFKNLVPETRYEFPLVTKQGAVKWVEQNVVMVTKGKRVVSFQCVVRDITQRKKAEEEIRRTNQFLDSVLENIPSMIFIKDARELRYLRANKATEKLLGFLQEDLIGKNDYAVFPPEQADYLTRQDREILNKKKSVDILEEPVRTAHGARWLHTKKIPVSDVDGKPLYLLGISEDITERKKSEDIIIELNKNLARYVDELEESQRFYKTIARNFPDGTITVLDSKLNYIFVDGKELVLEGIKADELLGLPYLSRFPKDKQHEIKEHLLSIFKGNTAIFETTLNDNLYIMHGVPLESATGAIDEILIVKQNITRLKHAEDNMKAALEREKLINELKTRFVSLASHEFRTPLSTIMSSTELIREYIEHDGQDPALLKEKNIHHLKRIKSSIQNMVNTLNSFLSLDQLEQGKIPINPVDFDVKELSAEVADELKPKLKNGQKIEYRHHSANTRVYMDRLMIKNVALNLLSNAIKYSPEGTVIKFTTGAGNKGLDFMVEDRGIGIPETEQSNLFERFFRAKNTLNIEGTGLGLSIVKKYIDLLNGNISFTSRENEGSIFRVFVSNAVRVNEPTIMKPQTV